ncbi:hypothetical protein [Nocardioides sp. W7]|uniref:hypothetical protein n=1 Tax=Nocardioides sp. W7 TaxID=2931390 RepID=UPI001FD3643C|nr:hypothetical protein [Nocardioides sp. W7]
MNVSSSIRYCCRVVGRSARPWVFLVSSQMSAYACSVGTDRLAAPRAATSGAHTSISISARRADSQATASSREAKVIGAR